VRVEFTGRQLEITPALKEFTQQKLNRIAKYLDDVAEAQVTLSIEKHRQIAEIMIKTKSVSMSASEKTDDMYVSIGLAINKIEKQAKRLKQKIWNRKRKLNIRKQNQLKEWNPPAPEEGSALREFHIIRSSNFTLKPMTVEEAALQIGMSRDQFIVFHNSKSRKINVIYKRKDGNLGLIEPEYD